MTRTFIQTREFARNWDDLGLNDDDLRRLELQIMSDPQIGAVMRGTGKLRKMRFALENGGKSGGMRVCYVDFLLLETVYLITVYPKSMKENLTSAERNDIRKMIMKLEESLKTEV
ncbi:MAG: type II toxin-antitoxin system RelE/ParE family toxin [Acetatifactor sp.]|nr:type II toxin-antitoxin system RelE/ParE family toxin [Acetatifactor sp.]